MVEESIRRRILAEISLSEAGAWQPVMLHKTGAAIWKSTGTNDELAEYLFKSDAKYSFWHVESPSEVLLAAHYLSSTRQEPFERSIHFAGVPYEYLRDVSECVQVDEATAICRGLLGRHYNVRIAGNLGSVVVARMRGVLINVPKSDLKKTDGQLRASKCRHYPEFERCDCELPGN